MYTLKYYDWVWGGYRRFDDYGDTAFPAEVKTLRKAKEVAKAYMSQCGHVRGVTRHAVEIIAPDKTTVGYMRRNWSGAASRKWIMSSVRYQGR